MNESWPALRIVHSIGGLRLVSDFEGNVAVKPLSLENNSAEFSIPNFHALFQSIHTINLPVYGLDIITHVNQIEGRDIPLWFPFMYEPNQPYDYKDATTLWQNIRTGAHTKKIGHLWDLSSRIAHQLRITAWRLKEISNAYKLQLDACIKRGEFKDNAHFSDEFTWICSMAVQAFLVDACILRDHLAEYASNYIYKEHVEQKNLKITTLSSLLKYVINKLDKKEGLALELSEISSENGWLKKLGVYRDLIVHSSPLSNAERKTYAIEKLLDLSGVNIPYIIFPIPDNPEKIYKFRGSLESYDNFDVLYSNFTEIFEGGYSTDALTYCHHSLSELARLALKMGDTSPVKPEKITIDEKDIIDFKRCK